MLIFIYLCTWKLLRFLWYNDSSILQRNQMMYSEALKKLSILKELIGPIVSLTRAHLEGDDCLPWCHIRWASAKQKYTQSRGRRMKTRLKMWSRHWARSLADMPTILSAFLFNQTPNVDLTSGNISYVVPSFPLTLPIPLLYSFLISSCLLQ